MRRLSLFTLCAFFVSSGTYAQNLLGNFWPNSNFESGDSLDASTGTPTGWKRGGSDTNICQVTSIAHSPTHALAVVDHDNNYGEWYSDVGLGTRVLSGDQLDFRWSEVYDITGTEMRVTVEFRTPSGGALAVKHYVVHGQSDGFTGDLATSPFVQRNETVDVPDGAATLRISLVSGGSVETTGTMIIDDLSVARHPAPFLLAGNLWTNNPTFELGTNLDLPTGDLATWNRGGSLSTIDQVTTTNFISPGHARAVVDRSSTGYGEYYSDLPLSGVARVGDTLNLQWFELFNVTSGGEMRLTVEFLNATGGEVGIKHFLAHNRSVGWAGSITNSPFVQRNENVLVPDGAATFRVSLVSGGGGDTQGTMIIDDFSMVKASPPVPDFLPGNLWTNSNFEQGTDLENAPTALPTGWTRGGNDPAIPLVTTNNSVSASHSVEVLDSNDGGYGEWDADFALGSSTAGGKSLDVQWFELYSVTNGEMRVSFVFSDASGKSLAENHFVAQGNSSGWKGAVIGSTFTRRNEQIAVPVGATRLRASVVSGGADDAAGVLLVDNLSLAPEPSAPVTLFQNFWPNPGFEQGTNLDQALTGTPAGWVRSGNNTIAQVLNSAYTSSTHSLALIDTNAGASASWSQTISLTGNVVPGDTLQAQWWQLFNIAPGGQMTLSINFLDAANTRVAGQDFTLSGSSTNWAQDLAHSFFDQRNEFLTVPPGAAKLAVTLTSGSDSTTGLLVIDDLSFAKPPPAPDLLAGNLWANPTFEIGVQLDKPAVGTPDGGWNRGGTYIPGDQITTLRATSPTHALAVLDTKSDAYSEWYVDKPLAGIAAPGDVLDLQWFELFDTQGDMRVSFLFRGADSSVVGQKDFVINGQSEGWTGDIATSPFVKRSEQLTVPDGAVMVTVTLASGGAESVTGTMIIDDLSVRNENSGFQILSLTTDATGVTLNWQSISGKTYSIESSSSFSPGASPFQPVTGLDAIAGDPSNITTAKDTRPNLGRAQFYRVRQLP